MSSNSGNSGAGGGYMKVQRHPRNAVASFGFALVAAAAFSADLTVPSITQAQLTGYKYPVKQARQTQPQDGWLYTAATPAFDPTVTVATIEQSQIDGYRYPRRTVRQTEFQDGWLETATHDWAVERTPYSLDARMAGRAALTYRHDGYPATDWVYENLPVVFDPQYLIHSDDSRMRERYKKVPKLDQPAQDWIYTSIPAFGPQYLIQVSAPTRMADRDKLDVRLAQFYNDMAWLRDVIGLPDPAAPTTHLLTCMGCGT